MCGSPVFDYEHIEGFEATGHDPDHMTLLCPWHHREKTAGRLPVETVRKANADPRNVKSSFSSSHELYFNGMDFAVELGNLRLKTDGVEDDDRAAAIVVDGAIVLGARITNGYLRLDVNIRDEHNRTLLRIDDGWLRVATENWDVEFTGTHLRVRAGLGKIITQIELTPPHKISLDRGKFYFNHVPILIGSDAPDGGLEIAERTFAGLTLKDGSITVESERIGYPTALGIRSSPRHYGAPPAPVGGAFSRRTRD